MSKKKIVISAAVLSLLIAAGGIAWRCRYFFSGTSSAPVQAKENKDFGIADIHSSVDKDGDGIDDNDPFQKSYEEDILESRDDITGHYRISE